MKKEIHIYTDGSCAKNRSGWGWVAFYNGDIITGNSGTQDGATNQQMELTAVADACEHVNMKVTDFNIIIKTDSAYIYNCWKDRWYDNWLLNSWKNSKKQPVANRDLWERIIPYFNNKRFTFEKVKGHNGEFGNEFADKLATEGKENTFTFTLDYYK